MVYKEIACCSIFFSYFLWKGLRSCGVIKTFRNTERLYNYLNILRFVVIESDTFEMSHPVNHKIPVGFGVDEKDTWGQLTPKCANLSTKYGSHG